MDVVRINGGDAGWEPGPAGSAGEPAEDAQEPRGHPLVLVTWRDAWFDFDEEDPEDVRADYLVNTVGFLVRQGPRFLSIAQEILPDGDGFRAVTHIPVSVVERISPLYGPDEAGMGDLASR